MRVLGMSWRGSGPRRGNLCECAASARQHSRQSVGDGTACKLLDRQAGRHGQVVLQEGQVPGRHLWPAFRGIEPTLFAAKEVRRSYWLGDTCCSNAAHWPLHKAALNR